MQFSEGHMFVYKNLDNGGDGKFEILLTDNSKVIVPIWASH